MFVQPELILEELMIDAIKSFDFSYELMTCEH